MESPSSPPRAPQGAGLAVRRATGADAPTILRLLAELDLDYPARDLDSFFVGERDGEVVAIAELRDFGTFRLLSCVGVREDLQGRGLGRALVERALDGVREDVVLYSQSPGFFARLGFERVESLPAGAPPRLLYGCEGCTPETCAAMVRRAPNVAAPVGGLPPLRRVTPGDAPLLARTLGSVAGATCDLTLPGLLLWRDCDRPALAEVEGHACLLLFPHHERPYALEPLPAAGGAAGDRLVAFEACLARVGRGSRLREEFALALPSDRFRVEPVRDHFDYVYDARRFSAPSGRKLDSLRNRIRKFAREHPRHEVRALSAGDDAAALALFDTWAASRSTPAPAPAGGSLPSIACQRRALERAFAEFEALALAGAALVEDGAMLGFLVGSRARDTAYVHFLHVADGLPGANQTLLHSCCRGHAEDLAWIDLEEDLGLEGLRRTKLSYRPDRLVAKYDATLR